VKWKRKKGEKKLQVMLAACNFADAMVCEGSEADCLIKMAMKGKRQTDSKTGRVFHQSWTRKPSTE